MKYVVRTTLERQLHESFNQIEFELLIDRNHNVRKIFIQQLESISNSDVVLMEDDIILCKDFKNRIEKIIAEHPKEIINFFSYPEIYFHSQRRAFISNQCTYFPKEELQNIINFFKNQKDFQYNKTPEEYIQLYKTCGTRNYYVYNPRPCLVQHIDEKSILNKHPVSVPRRTPYFIDYLEDLGISYEEAGTPENKQKLIDYMNKQFEGEEWKKYLSWDMVL